MSSFCHPYGVCRSSIHFPIASAVGYVVPSLRDSCACAGPYCLSRGAKGNVAGPFGVKWAYAAKDILDHVDFARVNRRHCVAILVGNGGVYSARRFKLVGCLSQRLVLGNFSKNSTSFRGASRRRGIPLRWRFEPREIPHSFRNAAEWRAHFRNLLCDTFCASHPFTLN